MNVPINSIAWDPCFRLIPTRYPATNLFSRIAQTPLELNHLDKLEMRRNERNSLTGTHKEITGPGSEYILAAFAYLNPSGSRFSDGKYGVFYAGKELNTSVAEVKYHRETFFRFCNEPPTQLEMKIIAVNLSGSLHDIRGLRRIIPGVYDPVSYATSQQFAKDIISKSSLGVVYDSVRHTGGECAAVFHPSIIHNCREEGFMLFQWDGKDIHPLQVFPYAG